MPFWPFGPRVTARVTGEPMRVTGKPVGRSATWDLEQRALNAFNEGRWEQAERLYRKVIATADPEGRQYARNMLGQILEKQGRAEEAIPLYEGNVSERSPFTFSHDRLEVLYRRLKRPQDEVRVLEAHIRQLEENLQHPMGSAQEAKQKVREYLERLQGQLEKAKRRIG